MTDLPHIISLHHAGTASPASSNGTAADSGDALGFLSQLLAQNTPAAGDASATDGTDTLTAKISAMLKGMPLSDIKAKLADLLQGQPEQAATTAAPAGTQDSLLHTLMAKLEAQLQAQQPTPGSPIAQKLAVTLTEGTAPAPSLTDMLNAIEPGSGDDSKIEQAVAKAATDAKTETAEQPLDPAILTMLKDKVAALQMTSDTADKGTLDKVKEDMIKSLKDQGLDQPSIDRYLGALASFLRGGNTATATASTDPAAATTEADDTAPILFMPASANAVAKPAAAQKADTAGIGKKAASDAQRQPDGNADATEQKSAPAARGTQAAAPANTAAPAQNAAARLSGLHLSPAIVSALAGNDAGLGTTTPDGLTASTALSSPAGTEAAPAGSNLVNYMSNMKGATPASVTQMVTLQLQQNMQNRVNSMTLQLHPADLGQMDIKLKFEKDGQVRAHMTVDKPETLAMLQKNSSFLEKTLQQNGVKIDENSITFDLRQQGRQQNMGGNDNSSNREQFAGRAGETGGNNLLQAAIAVQAQGYITQSGVNIMV